VNLALPADWRQVHVTVIDATGHPGLVAAAVAGLRARGLVVTAGGATTDRHAGVVTLRYGPQAVGAAWIIASQFGVATPGASVVWSDEFQPTRAGMDVDLILGQGFEQLASVTEVNQSVAARGLPMAPPGTCR
jgi:hypothetical protein